MRFVVPQSVVSGRAREPSGSPASTWRSAFPPATARTDHRPPAFSRRVHPLANARPLQRTAACCLPLRTTPKPPCDGPGSAERAPHLGFRALFATSAGGVHSASGDPSPGLRSVLGVSHALDGLRHHRPCRLVSSRSRVQGSPFRGLSLRTEPYRVSPAAALGPFRRTHLRLPAPARTPSASGPCSPCEVR